MLRQHYDVDGDRTCGEGGCRQKLGRCTLHTTRGPSAANVRAATESTARFVIEQAPFAYSVADGACRKCGYFVCACPPAQNAPRMPSFSDAFKAAPQYVGYDRLQYRPQYHALTAAHWHPPAPKYGEVGWTGKVRVIPDVLRLPGELAPYAGAVLHAQCVHDSGAGLVAGVAVVLADGPRCPSMDTGGWLPYRFTEVREEL